MSLEEITLSQILYGMGAGLIIAVAIAILLYLINYIINWTWWKKENRKDFADLQYFFKHRDEIKNYIKNQSKNK